MVKRIHHINFIVRDLEAAIICHERLLDMPVTSRDRLEGRGVDIARFKVGDTWLVLVQPTRADTIPARHLERHGEGFFLMSMEVADLDEEIARLGHDSFDGVRRRGLDNWEVIDILADDTFGAQLQFVTET